MARGARRLGQQVEPDPDRDPDDRLGRHGGGGVGAGRVAADLALDQDHVDVLQHARSGTGRATAGQAPPTRSRSRRAAPPAAGAPEPPAADPPQPERGRGQRQRRAEVARRSRPARRRPAAGRRPAARRLEHDRPRHRLVECAPCSAPRSTDSSSHSTPVGAVAAAAHVSGTEIRSAIGSRRTTAARGDRHADHAAAVFARSTASPPAAAPRRAGPARSRAPPRPAPPSPGTARITNVETSAASEP